MVTCAGRPGSDVLDFRATGASLAAIQAATAETAAGVLITLGVDSILLEGLTLAQLDWSADFVF